MFRRLHIQMTFFSALIIGIVIFIMTTACNFIAENSTGQNAWNTFQNNAISCISHLETQSIISSDWILQAEKNYDISMDIRDNGNSLYLKKLQTDSLDSVKHRILLQRLAFSGAAFLEILALSICSWFFTGRMITPLEKSRQEQTEFIAAASHELRSPLAVILSGISAMKKADPKEQEHFLSVIEKEGTRMSLLINDMLSLSNADNHSWKMHPVSCELDTLLLDTYEKYEPLMQDHHMKFFIELPEEEIPPCPCDPERISQVLGILLDNAISYVPENGKIILSLSQTETHFLIRVKDNGPGIPDSAKTSVFRRFYRADSARNNRQHFGLGLCIAYEIISLHKGTISVLDTPGGGSTFQISLPLA